MSIKELSEGKKNARDFTPEELKAASGGSVRHHKDGFEVFNSRSGESHGVFADYNEAVRVAKKHKISGIDTSLDNEKYWEVRMVGLAGVRSGPSRDTLKSLREYEDYTHSASPFGTGSFD